MGFIPMNLRQIPIMRVRFELDVICINTNKKEWIENKDKL